MWHQFIKNAPVPWSEGIAFADTLNLQLDYQAIRDETAMECATICTLKIRITCLPGQILARKLGDHLFGLLVYSQKPCSITAHKLTNQVQAVAPSASSMRREIYAIEHLCQVRFAGHLIPLISDPELS
jgi:hypothetical protein